MLTRTALAVGALFALPLSAPLAAATREPVRLAVPTQDLDLASPQGVKTLKGRVAAAIDDACETEVSSMHGDMEALRCRIELRRDASAKIAERLGGNPAVRVLGADSTGSN